MTSKSAWQTDVAAALEGFERLVILGVGNISRGDDAAGVRCAELLASRLPRRSARLKVLNAGDVPENFTGKIRLCEPSHVLIIDAMLGGSRPGTVRLVDRTRIADEEVSTHRIPLARLVEFLEATVGCKVIVLGIEPRSLEPGRPTTAAVEAAARRVAAFVAGLAARRLRSSSASGHKCS